MFACWLLKFDLVLFSLRVADHHALGEVYYLSCEKFIFHFLQIWLDNVLAFTHLIIMVYFFSLFGGYSESL